MTKALIIAYYWPPAGGPGVQRWLHFAKYLPEFQIVPTVLVPQGADYPIVDESLVSQVPEKLTVVRQKIREPYRLARKIFGKKISNMSSGVLKRGSKSWSEKLALWIRGNWFIPDARVAWVEPASRKAVQLIRDRGIDVIITTGPPHSLHMIGLSVKKELDIRWIADFRDPWTSIGYHQQLYLGKRAKKKHEFLEQQVLNSADKIITTSATTKNEFSKITRRPIAVITNGYDSTSTSISSELDSNFSLSFIGSLLSGRNPLTLWQSLAEMLEEEAGFGDKLSIKIAGVISEEVLDTLSKYGLEPYTQVLPYMAHQKAVELQRQSQLLLLIETDSKEKTGIIPGKLFEYLAAMRPILAIGPAEWEAGMMVEELRAGRYFDYRSQPELKAQLINWYRAYTKGGIPTYHVNIEQYSRRALSRRMAEEIRWE